nr:probable LRR receptor-like serine/threonine-protein kinase At3g47570 [Ipomoea batatas]
MMNLKKTLSLTHYFSPSSALCSLHLLLCLICAVTFPTSTSTPHFSNETDRIALLDLKHRIISGDSNGALLSSWNDSLHHCLWQGVSCGRRHPRVVALKLPDMGLGGTISPPYIGNLTFLRAIDLGGNGLQGQIPGEIGRLFRLRHLNLSVNALTGELVAINLGNCSQLRRIFLYENGLQGNLPTDLSNLKKMQKFSLDISLAINNLSGTFPSAFFNMTFLKIVSVTDNSFEGTIPSYIGDTMPYLRLFYLDINKFYGNIPTSFSNASKLEFLDISVNYFVGKVPDNIGKFKDLRRFSLMNNLLGSTGVLDDLAFISSLSNCSNLGELLLRRNRFVGKLPNTIANLSSQLTLLDVRNNKLHGPIPTGIKNLASLTGLALGKNQFSGVIPSEVGELQQLQGLSLEQNQFSGEIPHSLYNLTSLAGLDIHSNNLDGNIPSSVGNFWDMNELYLSHNRLNGTIPQQIFELPSLSKYLDLSSNSFTGSLSPAVGKLKALNALDISKNKLSGKIPETIGDCLGIEHLDMHANLFEGKIPPSLISLKSIRYLDISNNKLTGEIPREFQNLHFLQHLNLSFNDLEGEVPTVGVFAVATNVSLLGNKKLCGGVAELKLPPCPVKKTKHKKHVKLMIVIFTCTSVALVIASFLVFLTLHWRKERMGSSKLSKVGKLSKVAYKYGIGAKASTFGDVYSFGILLLEMFTAKRPTDDLFNGDCSSLYEYVAMALPEQVREIVDPLLSACLESSHGITPDVELESDGNLVEIEESKVHNFFLSIFKIGLTCASRSPMDRMHMNEVSRELQKIKKAFFA